MKSVRALGLTITVIFTMSFRHITLMDAIWEIVGSSILPVMSILDTTSRRFHSALVHSEMACRCLQISSYTVSHTNRKPSRLPHRLVDELMLALDQALGHLEQTPDRGIAVQQAIAFGRRVLSEARRRLRERQS
jgi:hypothetical protein